MCYRFNTPLRSQFNSQQLLQMFLRLVRQPDLEAWLQNAQHSFYARIFSPLITLWYLIFQRLNSDPTLAEVVTDVHQGGADGLGRGPIPLSQKIRSWATTAYSNARQRLPLCVLTQGLVAQSRQILALAQNLVWRDLQVRLLDGSTVRLRPLGDIAQHFPPQSNHKKLKRKTKAKTRGKNRRQPKRKTPQPPYWCLMRVVVSFCARSAVAMGCAVGAMTHSEQELACQLIRQAVAQTLFIGDRNFGVFRIVQAARHVRAHVLVRLTEVRARKLVAGSLRVGREYPVSWSPSRHDQQEPGCASTPVPGRLIVAQVQRKGFRAQRLLLFTTLLEASTYRAEALIEMYGVRWQIELDLRYLKAQMELEQLECKSAAMAQKEWFAGLLAYNLIRALMLCAALQAGVNPLILSFSAARRQLEGWLEHFGARGQHRLQVWDKLLAGVAQCRQPKRKKPRPSEPRAKRYVRESFPPLYGSRSQARKELEKNASKN